MIEINASEAKHLLLTRRRGRPFAAHDGKLAGFTHQFRSVVIIAAPIKRPYIWDLLPAVSAIRYCLGAGLRVYLLEWLPASDETCCVGLAECGQAISASLAKIEPGPEGDKPVLMGHSLGGTLAAIYAATAPSTIDGLVLLSSPLCFRADESAFRDAVIFAGAQAGFGFGSLSGVDPLARERSGVPPHLYLVAADGCYSIRRRRPRRGYPRSH